jgi:transcriptional regulator with GAF, ATPase, and Fis domain
MNSGNKSLNNSKSPTINQKIINGKEKLLNAVRNLSETLDSNEVLTRIAERAKEILDAYAVAIYLPHGDEKKLQPIVAIDPQYEKEILSQPIPIDSSFTGRAIKEKKTLIFNNAWTDQTGYQIPGTSEENNERIIVSPFVSDDKVLGAICLNKLHCDFTEDDRAIAEIFAIHATSALKNALNHKALQLEI